MDWFQNDALFFEQVQIGHKWAVHCGALFLANGLVTYVNLPTLRDNIEDRHAYVNEGDIWVAKPRCRPVLIEVKSRNLAFTTPQDYPYATAFVDTVGGWDAKTRKPFAVCLVSQKTGVVLVVQPDKVTFTTDKHFDSVRSITVNSYAVATAELCSFAELCKRIKEESVVKAENNG